MHQHSWLKQAEPLTIETVIDDWLGPTLALIQCNTCHTKAVINLVGWRGARLCERIYAVRVLETAVAETYQRNISHDYCDLNRKQQETDALISASSLKADLVRLILPELLVLSVCTDELNPPFKPWQDIEPMAFERWEAHLRGHHP